MNTQILLVSILVVVVFGVGFMIGRVTASQQITPFQATSTDKKQSANQEGTTVQSANLSPSQRQMLESFGINADEITITQEMIVCAEAKIGADRVEEIKNGATPTFPEGMALVGCYQ